MAELFSLAYEIGYCLLLVWYDVDRKEI